MVGADLEQDELERKLYIIRKRAEKYICFQTEHQAEALLLSSQLIYAGS
jgi:hypothetical protein